MTPGGHTLLVVEDNPDHALLVRVAALRAEPDLDVRIVTRGEAALAYLNGQPPFDDVGAHPRPELIILDLLLPGMGGFDVLTELVQRGGADGVPVVVLTSSVNPGDRGRALALGASAFHSKPPDLDGLGAVMRDILDRWLP